MLNNQLRFSAHYYGLTATGLAQSSFRSHFLHKRKNEFDYCTLSVAIRPRSLKHKAFIDVTRFSFLDRRYMTVFKGSGGIFSLIGDRKRNLPAWHDCNFMKNHPIEDKELWLENQINRVAKSSDNAMLDVEAYNFVLKSWAREATSNKAAAFHAEKWLLRLRQEYYTSESWNEEEQPTQYSDSNLLIPTSHIQPNVESYNAVLEAWSKSSDLVAVIRSERWLSELCKSTNTLSIEDRGASDEKLMQSNKDSTIREGPTTESYNYYLATLSKGIGKTKQDIQRNAVKAEQTLRNMIAQWEKNPNVRHAPNTDSFNYVMIAITKCKSDLTIADRVMEWLRLMESFQRATAVSDSTFNSGSIIDVRPNTKSYTVAINAWGILAQQKKEASVRVLRRQRALRGVQVNKRRLTSADLPQVTNSSYTRTNAGVDEVQKAKDILDYMHVIHKAGSTEVIPDSMAYNSVISAWSKISSEYNEDAPLRAEEILREMLHLFEDGIYPEIHPTHFSYTNVIHAWTKLKSMQSTKRAEWWLKKMWRAVENESLGLDDRQKRIPNTFTYNTIIKSWCDLREAKRADSLLRELLDKELEGKYPLSPNTDTYALVISAWTKREVGERKSEAGVGLETAFQLLQDMIKREEEGRSDIFTDIDVFNNVLKSAAESPLCSSRIYNVAVKTFYLLDCSRHTPDHFSYKYLLQAGIKVLSTQSDESKLNNFIKVAVKRCCDNGQLSRGVLQVISGYANILEETMDWPPPNSCSRNISNPEFLPVHPDVAIDE